MLFNSLEFILFFPIVCLVYYLLPGIKGRTIFLLLGQFALFLYVLGARICVVAVDKYIDYLYFGLVHGPFSVSSKA